MYCLKRSFACVGLGVLTLSGCDARTALVQPEPIAVTISQPARQEIADFDEFTGHLDAVESVEVRARVRGELKAIYFADGALVKAGDLLFEIDPRTYQATLDGAKARKASAQSSLNLATAEYERTYQLFKQNAASARDVEVWIAKKAMALADINLTQADIDRAKLDLDFATIRAPISGKISQTQVTKGNLVNAGGGDMLLTTIVTIDPMFVKFNVPERALLKYQNAARQRYVKGKPNGKPQIPVELILTADTGTRHKGVIDFIDNKVDPNTGTINVRARFANPNGPDGRPILIAGLFARVRIAVTEPYEAVLVADRAILSDQNLKYVLVVNKEKNNTVERVDIEPADRQQSDGLRAVVAGLSGDEWVIVEGVNRTRPGATIAPREAPMPRRPAKSR